MSTPKEEQKVASAALAIIGVLDGALTIINHVNYLRQQARERGELTPEQDAELDAKLAAMFQSAAWQPSIKIVPPVVTA